MTGPATNFVLKAIQSWAQSEEEARLAVQGVLDAAGFMATAGAAPVFGNIWPEPCAGPEGAAASAWLQSLTDTMKRGRFEDEVKHVENAVAARRAEIGA